MAARENQGYLIAVIILILVVLILALATFLGFSRANEHYDARIAKEKSFELAENRAEGYRILSDILFAYVGKFGLSTAEVETNYSLLTTLPNKVSDDSLRGQVTEIVDKATELKKQYDADMKLMIATGTGEQSQEMTWRGLVDNYAAALGKIHNINDIANNEVIRINSQAQSDLAAKETIVQQTQAALQTAQNDLSSEKQAHQADVTKLQTTLDTVRQENKDLGDTYDRFRREADANNKKLSDEVANITRERDLLKEKVDRYELDNFDIADGRIVRVSPELQSVFLNIGHEDGLRSNQSFAIFDQTVNNFEKDQHKAMIEVTRVTGPHQAIARITQETPTNPILANDQVLSAVWDPGYRVPIAVAGKFDIDFDGRDDRDRLIQMIERNGGKVVAWHDAEGKVHGKVDSATRYFVVGDPPDAGGPDANPDMIKGMRELSTQARANSVQEIDIRKLLNWMGMHGVAEIEPMDAEIGEKERRKSATDNNSR